MLELTELVKDFTLTKHLSKIELDFLEGELWETLEHIDEITSLIAASVHITKELRSKDGSSWQLCCTEILDLVRPQKKLEQKSSNS